MTDELHPSDRELGLEVETGTGELRLDLTRRLAAEAFGTGMLIVAVIGSGIAASRLSAGDVGLQLLENAAATAGRADRLDLDVRRWCPAPTSTRSSACSTGCWAPPAPATPGSYIVAQVIGGCLGAMLANVMFQLPVVSISTHVRSSPALWVSEVVATVTLLVLIQACVRTGRASVIPFAVGAWIGGAYWFTSSTSFANPAVTVARTLSNSFAGIAPSSAPMFIVMQLIGMVIAFGLVRLFYPHHHSETPDA